MESKYSGTMSRHWESAPDSIMLFFSLGGWKTTQAIVGCKETILILLMDPHKCIAAIMKKGNRVLFPISQQIVHYSASARSFFCLAIKNTCIPSGYWAATMCKDRIVTTKETFATRYFWLQFHQGLWSSYYLPGPAVALQWLAVRAYIGLLQFHWTLKGTFQRKVYLQMGRLKADFLTVIIKYPHSINLTNKIPFQLSTIDNLLAKIQ